MFVLKSPALNELAAVEQHRIEKALYLPLVMVALSGWQSHRLYPAPDTHRAWERYRSAISGLRTSRTCCGAC